MPEQEKPGLKKYFFGESLGQIQNTSAQLSFDGLIYKNYLTNYNVRQTNQHWNFENLLTQPREK